MSIGGLISSSVHPTSASEAISLPDLPTAPSPSPRPFAYSVEMKSPPCLIPRTARGETSLIQRLSNAEAILLGSHMRNTEQAKRDVSLEINLLKRLLAHTRGRIERIREKSIGSGGKERELVIGLPLPANTEIIAALDAYTLLAPQNIEEDDKQLFDIIHKYIRPNDDFQFSYFLSLLHFAKEQGVRLLPVDVSSQVIDTVREDGLGGIPEEIKTALVPDTTGFMQSVLGDGFKRYSETVLGNTYVDTVLASNGTLSKLPVENYIASRLIRDESIAARATKWIQTNENVLLVLCLSEDQVKYGYGVQERLKRNLHPESAEMDSRSDSKTDTDTDTEKKITETVANRVYSVLLNPTASDSYSETVQLRLSLAYGIFLKDQRPLADFLWFSDFPPVKLLTRPKNAINAEGEKPPGESSILKAF
eukprot:CAMPEP_0182421186 /NCGR_PEP_ID=MMETSP1167-20130531/6450_1 /TAXON_ID=2988 /ORGANISM="Mallomonas Sp, Strain CCMP3275" /LENGTH=420 /DNA_ID=CAMNT_0024598055 /DNA_START=276 /DNA_END=1538 /DNA_ORIENTATION=-